MKILRYPRIEIIVSSLWLVLLLTASRADTPAIITDVERQPLEASVARLVEALRGLGDPLPEAGLIKRFKSLRMFLLRAATCWWFESICETAATRGDV